MTRFRDEDITWGGIRGEHLTVASGNPRNYHQVISDPGSIPPLELDAKLFLPETPESGTPQPVVMVVPGSLGVGPNHRAHTQALVEAGIGACLIDPFGPRAVTSTVANQTQYSFAASAYDVLATMQTLAADDRIDATRISAQGHSRGGSAVMTASMRRFADPIVGTDLALAGCYAVYPWCGHMFYDANTGSTNVRAIVGERDDWVSPQLVQAQIHAIRNSQTMTAPDHRGEASVRVVPDAHHSFDRRQDLETYPDAAVAPNAPAVFICDDGSMDSPHFDGPSADRTDYDVFVAAAKGGHGVTGATIGSTEGQPELFAADMFAFHREALGL